MYARQSQLAGRSRLRALRVDHARDGADLDCERERFTRLADPASAPRAVSAFNLFQTPEALALRMAGMLGERQRVLEPSAGLGRLYFAVRSFSDCDIVAVEASAECAGELSRTTRDDSRARVICSDFMAQDADSLGTFGGVIMNPPFKRGLDIVHIQHALGFLEPGGLLVGLCATGPKQYESIEPIADSWKELPAGTFDGTRVVAALFTIQR